MARLTVSHMITTIRKQHLLGVFGFLGFLLCAWFAYLGGLHARDSASQAYTLWLSGDSASEELHVASRSNALWTLAVIASILLALVSVSACFCSLRRVVLRRGFGLILLASAFLPAGFAFTILLPLLNVGGTLSPGARVTSWSTGGIILQGWQMHAGVILFAFAALSMLAGGAYLLLSGPNDD